MAGRSLGKWGRGLAVGAIACAGFLLALLPSWADTLEGAPVQAYQNNPSLNSQRASVRATDEGVPQALSGYRPKVSINGSIGTQYWDTTNRTSTSNPKSYIQQSGTMTPNSYGITATQTLYNGFQTANKTRQPGKLAPGSPVDRFSPRDLPQSVGVATATHPAVSSAQYNVDVALGQVKVAEGALYPTLSLQGSVLQNNESAVNAFKSFNGVVLGQLSVPIYQGGAEYSLIRQAKETLGQRRLDLDTARDQVRQTVVQSWGNLEAAKANIEATQANVQAAEIALNGVREEARVGQRTTVDVLNAQSRNW